MVPEAFAERHIGPRPDGVQQMLSYLGLESLEGLTSAAVPSGILEDPHLDLPPPASEAQVVELLRGLAAKNQVLVSMIGLGYYGTFTPAVVLRMILENPDFYTGYTPYQPEISQGRLELLALFQKLVTDMTGLDYASASLLDEATAAAEAMALCCRVGEGAFVIHPDCFPQTQAVVLTRAEAMGVEVVVADSLPAGPLCGLLLPYPGASGQLDNYQSLVAAAKERGALVVVACDLLALTLLQPPGEWGADVAVGSAQRLGVPMWGGGPHAAFMAVRSDYLRQLPGRLVGVSVDAAGNPAYRLSLGVREQHIRRHQATSNICTAQALLAMVAAAYAAYHGPEGLQAIASRVNRMAAELAVGLRLGSVRVVHQHFFDTVLAHVPARAEAVVTSALARGINLRLVDADHVAITCDETTTREHLELVLGAFGVAVPPAWDGQASIPASLVRRSSFLTTEPRFHTYHSETAMMRYLRGLADRDLALSRTSIPLGSCTMKLNPAAAMVALSWPEFANLHPYAPVDQLAGYQELVGELEAWLAHITGYHRVSIQPNAGSQGELAGLLAIRGYYRSIGQPDRTVCLIPQSAHGTNPASAVMAGMQVVVVACDRQGNIDLEDLQAKLTLHGNRLACIMLTYPSTHGIYEAAIGRICELVHAAGGQVYIDGANLNALVGLARPGRFGADVSHLNLHKTFCIPHGGGGPGVGPVAVAAHLAPFLPGDPLTWTPASGGVGPVSAARWGSAGILTIPWAYIRLMGGEGLRRATQVAVLNANYVARRLAPHFPVLYTGPGGWVAHECIIDLRGFKGLRHLSIKVAKRLADYGFHAPTVNFPVPGTLMIEPTESEDLAELKRLCQALIAIRGEIDRIVSGEWPVDDNPLVNAPHTALMVTADKWDHGYTRQEAATQVGPGKYWPPVGLIDEAHGDRHLTCDCPGWPPTLSQASQRPGS